MLDNSTQSTNQISILKVLDDELIAEGLSKAKLAREIGVHPQTIYKLYSGAEISPKLAKLLERRFGIKAIFWLSKDKKIDSNSLRDDTPKRKEENHQETLVDFRIRQELRSQSIKVSNMEDRLIKSASIDLTIGHFCNRHFNKKKSNPNKTTLKFGESANIELAQHVDFPKNFLARVGTKTTFVKKGILVLTGHQIDPGYKGYLHVKAINLSSQPITLAVSEPIISLELVKLQHSPTDTYIDFAKESLSEIRAEIEDRVRKSLVSTDLNDQAAVEWSKAEIFVNTTSKISGSLDFIWNEIHHRTEMKANLKPLQKALKSIFKKIVIDNTRFLALLKLLPGTETENTEYNMARYRNDSEFNLTLRATCKNFEISEIDLLIHIFPKSDLLEALK